MTSLARLLGCNVYVSEGRNVQLIRALEASCKSHKGVALISTFIDAPYHRSSFCLASPNAEQLAGAVAAVAHQALVTIDMTRHQAAHPRLGAVDHISCHPLGAEAHLAHAAQLAADIGARLAAPPARLPVYLYGAAHPEGRPLADIRRRLGYFRPATAVADPSAAGTTTSGGAGAAAAAALAGGSGADEALPGPGPGSAAGSQGGQQRAAAGAPLQCWQGAGTAADLSGDPPDLGPPLASAVSGVLTLGAIPWLVNFNVQLQPGADLAAAKRLARTVSERGGGLRSVQAMGLAHDGCLEVACNLLDPAAAPPAAVQARLEALARAQGLRLGRSYLIGRSPEEVVAAAAEQLGLAAAVA